MLGQGRVCQRSIVSVIDASRSLRVEKRKHSVVHPRNGGYGESPKKARILERPSIASTTSSKFGDEHMIKAQHGLLERQSLEDSCLIADGEDISGSCK
jgi:serine/arginine repetitive matrix protein 2